MKKKYFSSYQSVTDNQFEIVEKSKQYEKYLKRIESIVHKRPRQDFSPIKYMKAQRQYKESVHKLARQQLDHEIEAANQILQERIASHMNRKPEKYQKYELVCDLPRRKELSRIDGENHGIAERLAERYAHRKKKSLLGTEIYSPKLQHKVKRSPPNKRLPELVRVLSLDTLQTNS